MVIDVCDVFWIIECCSGSIQYLYILSYTGKCATCVKNVFLKRMLNVRLTHGKRVNRVNHV